MHQVSIVIFTETRLKTRSVSDLERRRNQRCFFARAFAIMKFKAQGLNLPIASGKIGLRAIKGARWRGPAFPIPAGG